MRYILLLVLITANMMTAQVGEVEVMEKPILIGYASDDPRLPPMLYYQNTQTGWQYILFYFEENIAKLEYMKTIPFYGTPEDLEKVYGIFMDVFEKDDIRTFSLGKVDLRISQSVASKELLISVMYEDGGDSYFNLNRKQVDMLFGK